jgi:hypothetical protein
MAEAVPGCLHVSLSLFFMRLGESLFNINTTVGMRHSSHRIYGLLYLDYISAHYISAITLPEHISGIIWFLFQKLRIWKYRDQGPNGKLKPVAQTWHRDGCNLRLRRQRHQGAGPVIVAAPFVVQCSV